MRTGAGAAWFAVLLVVPAGMHVVSGFTRTADDAQNAVFSAKVEAVRVDVLVTNPYYRNTSRKLILSIKGEDLAAFRAGKITRDEAKQRIVDTRF